VKHRKVRWNELPSLEIPDEGNSICGETNGHGVRYKEARRSASHEDEQRTSHAAREEKIIVMPESIAIIVIAIIIDDGSLTD